MPRLFFAQNVAASPDLQITHGDVARACGYCETIGIYQKPADRWRKTFEDRAFRWLMGTQGTALEVPGACQIRHAVKGRYKQDSFISTIRMFIRRNQDKRAKSTSSDE